MTKSPKPAVWLACDTASHVLFLIARESSNVSSKLFSSGMAWEILGYLGLVARYDMRWRLWDTSAEIFIYYFSYEKLSFYYRIIS